jgi:hypothetical protein
LKGVGIVSLPEPIGSTGVPVRLSNDDRERAVELLNQAVADGRLTWPEHAERVESVYAARVAPDLLPVLADLGPAGVAVNEGTSEVTAVFSKIVRVPDTSRRIRANSVFGAVVLNLASVPPGQHIDVEVSSFCGKVQLMVADDATVIDEGTAILGKRAVYGEQDGADGPVIRLTGTVKLGNLKVFRV